MVSRRRSIGIPPFRTFFAFSTMVTRIAAAITSTDPDLPPLVARAHASVLVTVIQAVTDRVGAAVLSGTDLASLTEQLHIDADVALVDAAENFRATKRRMSTQTR